MKQFDVKLFTVLRYCMIYAITHWSCMLFCLTIQPVIQIAVDNSKKEKSLSNVSDYIIFAG